MDLNLYVAIMQPVLSVKMVLATILVLANNPEIYEEYELDVLQNEERGALQLIAFHALLLSSTWIIGRDNRVGSNVSHVSVSR